MHNQTYSLMKVFASVQVNVGHTVQQISDTRNAPLQDEFRCQQFEMRFAQSTPSSRGRIVKMGNTERVTKMHWDWWRDSRALNSLPLPLHLMEELPNQTIDDAVNTNHVSVSSLLT